MQPPIPVATGLVHFFETFEYLTGFLLVILTLTMMWGMTALIGRFFIGRENRTTSAPAPAIEAAPAPAPAPVPDGLTPQLVAVIAAAVAAVVKQPHAVVAIRPADGDWSREGRRQIFASKRVR